MSEQWIAKVGDMVEVIKGSPRLIGKVGKIVHMGEIGVSVRGNGWHSSTLTPSQLAPVTPPEPASDAVEALDTLRQLVSEVKVGAQETKVWAAAVIADNARLRAELDAVTKQHNAALAALKPFADDWRRFQEWTTEFSDGFIDAEFGNFVRRQPNMYAIGLGCKIACELVYGQATPAQQPTTAYDFHRAITLVQVLAIDDPAARLAALENLCATWGVHPASYRTGYVLSIIHRLADAALQHAREDE